MRIIILFIFTIFSTAAFSQSYNVIYGKQRFNDSVQLSKFKNNIAGDSVLTVDTLGKIKLVKIVGGSGATYTANSPAIVTGNIISVDTSKAAGKLATFSDFIRRNFNLIQSVDSSRAIFAQADNSRDTILFVGGGTGGGTTYTGAAPIVVTGSVISADTSKASGKLATFTDVGIVNTQTTANTAAIQQRMDSLRNNAGVLEARKGGVFVPQFTLPTGGSSLTVGAILTTGTANAATITGSILQLNKVTGTTGGIFTNSTDTIGGDKLLNGTITIGITGANSTKFAQVSGYNGIWFNQATPALTNYAFLFDYGFAGGTTDLNGPGGVNIRVNNVYSDQVEYNSSRNLGVGYTAGSVPANKFNVNGNASIDGNLKFNQVAGTSGQVVTTNVSGVTVWVTPEYRIGYTVATLPAAGTVGRLAYVTDATAPTYLGTLTGGGTVKTPVFDNGVSWVAH